jgi:hypothetical protein
VAIFAAVVADRMNRRTLIIVADTVIVVTIGILALIRSPGFQELQLIDLVLFIRSCGAGVCQRCCRRCGSRRDERRRWALDRRWTALLGIALFLTIKVDNVERLGEQKHFFHELADGFRFTVGHREIRWVLVFFVAIMVMVVGFTVALLPNGSLALAEKGTIRPRAPLITDSSLGPRSGCRPSAGGSGGCLPACDSAKGPRKSCLVYSGPRKGCLERNAADDG